MEWIVVALVAAAAAVKATEEELCAIPECERTTTLPPPRPTCDRVQVEREARDAWPTYKSKYNKDYSSDEDSRRLDIFIARSIAIADHNLASDARMESFSMAVNKFADRSSDELLAMLDTRMPAEFDARFHDYQPMKEYNKNFTGYELRGSLRWPKLENVSYDMHMDWREHGIVGPVKDQGYNGGGWAFAAVGTLESHYAMQNSFIRLSEQDALDCVSGSDGNNMFITDVYKYAMRSCTGISSEESYPFTGTKGACRSDRIAAAHVKTFAMAKEMPYIESVVRFVGPAAGVLHFDESTFFYKQGVYRSRTCHSGAINHAVTIVATRNGNMILKNSFGTDWGVDGFMEMEWRYCGSGTALFFPFV